MNFEQRISEAMTNGDVTELREILGELNIERLEVLQRASKTRSRTRFEQLRFESKKLAQLASPLDEIVNKRRGQR